jgi:putative flavoprotein involved in K+ transport
MNAHETNPPDNGLDTIVVGGGQAGLAVGYYLAQQKRHFVILDERDEIGDAWRMRWDSLRLFTPAKYDGLPGMAFPGDGLVFPSKDELAAYLRAYADRFNLPVRTGVRASRLWREHGRYVVASADGRWEADNVVIATGSTQTPNVPTFADQLPASVVQLHSAQYRNPDQLQEGPVLVVGLGNSGAEIALEVARIHPTIVAGEPSGELPVRHGRTAARFVLPFVRFAGLHVLNFNTPIGRKVLPKLREQAAPLIRTKRADLIAAGVTLVPRVTGVQDGKPMVDGEKLSGITNVIWCTGYRDDFRWVDLPAFDEKGRPRQYRGVSESADGLYFLGQEFQFAVTSATLPGMSRDAAYLARRIGSATRRTGSSRAAPVGQR